MPAQSCGFDVSNIGYNLNGQIKTGTLVDIAYHVHCTCPPPNFPVGLIDRLIALIEVRDMQSDQAEESRYQRESQGSHAYFLQTLRQMREVFGRSAPKLLEADVRCYVSCCFATQLDRAATKRRRVWLGC